MEKEKILYLLSAYNEGRISTEEQAELDSWISESDNNQLLFKQLTDKDFIQRRIGYWNVTDTEASLNRVKFKISQLNAKKKRYFYSLTAVVLTSLLAIGIMIYKYRDDQLTTYTGKEIYEVAKNIQSGSDRATLTLDDGQVVDLAQAAKGHIALDNGASISKTANGEISYEPVAQAANTSYNTIHTPKGGQFQVRLPDGTRVWLNAASSLHYPTSMSQARRVVELTGEAYFEVAHNKAKPFVVVTASQDIEVLGTHFNVNSYQDEINTVTTLIEGSVKVSTEKQQMLLKPGQQSIGTDNRLKVLTADMEQALAWKNGQIRFSNATLEEILKQAARWYNIDIRYNGTLPVVKLTGAISRSDNMDVLLKLLELNEVKFDLSSTGKGYQLIIRN